MLNSYNSGIIVSKRKGSSGKLLLVNYYLEDGLYYASVPS